MMHVVDGKGINRRDFVRSAVAAGAVAATPALLREQLAGAAGRGKPSIGALDRAVEGEVVTAASPDYDAAARVFNIRWDGAEPLAVVRATSEDDVEAAVRWANDRKCRVVARSGGHSYAGYSTGDDVLVIDIGALGDVSIADGGIATVGAGAQLIDVYLSLAEEGLTIPAGTCPSVGIGGLALGGGMGLAGRKLGLTCDRIRGLRIVTADGRARRADQNHSSDLYWACRGGGGGNFGIVTSFDLKTYAVTEASRFTISVPWSSAEAALNAWQFFAPTADADLTALITFRTGSSEPNVTILGQYFGPESELPDLLKPLTDVAFATLETATLSYADMVRYWAGCTNISDAACHTEGTRQGGTLPRDRFNAKSDYVREPLNQAGRSALVGAIEARQAQGAQGSAILDAYGGAIADVGPKETAFVHRSELFSIQYLTYFDSGEEASAQTWLDTTEAAMKPYVSGFSYQNYIDPTREGWEHAYYGANLKRLRKIKRKYDPHFRFRFPQAIRPS